MAAIYTDTPFSPFLEYMTLTVMHISLDSLSNCGCGYSDITPELHVQMHMIPEVS